LPRGASCRRAAVCHPDPVRAPGRSPLLARFARKPDASGSSGRSNRLHRGHAHRWSGPRAVGGSPLDELPLGGRLRHSSSCNDPARKAEVLRALSDHVIPGRWEDVRRPSEQELRQTLVLSIPINEASAKIRKGPPIDDEADYELPVWAGVVPLSLVAGTPIGDARLRPDVKLPAHAANYQGPKGVSIPSVGYEPKTSGN
jgi:hypothetical protein